jgi:hypothetical protein
MTSKVATSSSSISSNTTSTQHQFFDAYETPGTSAVATPAEAAVSSSTTKSKSSKVATSMRTTQLRNSGFSRSSNAKKRKRIDGGDGESDPTSEKHLGGMENDLVQASESAFDDSIRARVAPKRRKAKVMPREFEQAIDEQLALALEQEENDGLDTRVATAISMSLDQETCSDSESDDISLFSRSGRGKMPAFPRTRVDGKGLQRGRPGSTSQKEVKRPSRAARPKSAQLKQEIPDSELGDLYSSGGMTDLEESDDWGLLEVGYGNPSKSTKSRSKPSRGKRIRFLEDPQKSTTASVSGMHTEEDIPPGPTLPARTGFRPSRRANRVLPSDRVQKWELIWHLD